MTELQRILVGFIISLVLGLFAFRSEALSQSGTLAAILVGSVVYIFGGIGWFILLAVFFLTSQYFTSFKAKEKESVVREFAKGGIRDFWQVLANGGIVTLLAVGYFSYHSLLFFYAFLGVLGTVTADTWATEVGILGRQRPRLITTGKPVAVGTSGAISVGGTLSAAAGAGVIAVCALLLSAGPAVLSPIPGVKSPFALVLITVFASLAGAMVDSYLGATVQAMYYCTRDKKETEKLVHSCGEKTVAIRGFPWFDNDLVNLSSSMAGGLIAAALFFLFGG